MNTLLKNFLESKNSNINEFETKFQTYCNKLKYTDLIKAMEIINSDNDELILNLLNKIYKTS